MNGELFYSIKQKSKAIKMRREDNRKHLKCKNTKTNFKLSFLKGNKSIKLNRQRDQISTRDKSLKKMQNDLNKKNKWELLTKRF